MIEFTCFMVYSFPGFSFRRVRANFYISTYWFNNYEIQSQLLKSNRGSHIVTLLLLTPSRWRCLVGTSEVFYSILSLHCFPPSLQKYKEYEKDVAIEEIDGLQLVKKLAKNMEEMFHKKSEAVRVSASASALCGPETQGSCRELALVSPTLRDQS